MARIFNFSECYRLLATNPKTFKGWLEKAGIDPEKQVNIADPRQKYLTLDQLQMLAAQHGRPLPSFDEEVMVVAPMTIEQLAEQLATIQNLLADVVQMVRHPLPTGQEQRDYQPRFDRVDQALAQVTMLVQERMVEQEVPSPQDEPKAPFQEESQSVQAGDEPLPQPLPISEAVAAPSTSPAPIIPKNPSRTTPKLAKTPSGAKRPNSKSKRRTGKAKLLPRTLVPLRVVAKQHTIDMKVADRVSESGKLAVVSGNWLYESRAVTKALDMQGQQEFYRVFHLREGFTRCEQCPHGFQGQDDPTESEAVGIAR